jgi:hypothetical protein
VVVFSSVLISVLINCIQVIWHFLWNHAYFIVMNDEHVDKLYVIAYLLLEDMNLLIRKTKG